jgi:HlyD family secretion protein
MSTSPWIKRTLAVLVLGIGWAAWEFHATTEVEVSTSTVTAGPITRRIVATGTLQAVTTVDVGTEVSGVVQSLEADYNSPVHVGQIIARIDPSAYDAQAREAGAALAQAWATLDRAHADVRGFEAAVEDARMKLTRAQALSDLQLIPQSDLDAARIAMGEATADLAAGEAAVDEAGAAVQQATSAVEEASINVEHTIIRSPIDGIAIERDVAVGQTLAASIQSPVLFRIAADLKQMQVQVDVDESDVAGLAPGEPATFQVESYRNETFRGTVSQVRLQPIAVQTTAAVQGAPGFTTTAAASVIAYAVIVDVTNSDERLRPGMTAEVALAGLRREHAVRIPDSALQFHPSPEVLNALGESATPTPGFATVWVFDGKRLTPIAVRAGLAGDGWTELLSGPIRSGDALVTSAVVQRRSRS